MITSAGWIAPDGKFYPCESYGHYDSSREICQERYPEIKGQSDEILMSRGWIRLWANGCPLIKYSDHYKGVTQAQMDTLYDLAREDTPFSRNIYKFLDEEAEYWDTLYEQIS